MGVVELTCCCVNLSGTQPVAELSLVNSSVVLLADERPEHVRRRCCVVLSDFQQCDDGASC